MNVEKRLLRIASILDKFASKMVKNPNPKGRKKMVTEEYAERWIAENRGGGGKKPAPAKTSPIPEKALDKLQKEKERLYRSFETTLDRFYDDDGMSDRGTMIDNMRDEAYYASRSDSFVNEVKQSIHSLKDIDAYADKIFPKVMEENYKYFKSWRDKEEKQLIEKSLKEILKGSIAEALKK